MTLVSQPAAQAQDADCFRALMRRQASTVTVVTAPGLPPAGLTATEFTSVSLRPPVVSFCLSRDSSSWPTVACADHVAVHLLTDNHQNVAERLGTGGIDRFTTPTTWTPGPHDVPILDNALGWLLCRGDRKGGRRRPRGRTGRAAPTTATGAAALPGRPLRLPSSLNPPLTGLCGRSPATYDADGIRR